MPYDTEELYTDEARLILRLHRPTGAYCVICDSDAKIPDDIDGVNNPHCSHQFRGCATCRAESGDRIEYPCQTIVAASVMDATGIIGNYMNKWNLWNIDRKSYYL